MSFFWPYIILAIGTATPPFRSLAVSPLRRKSRAMAGLRSNVPSLMHCDLFVFWQWFTYFWHLVDAVSTSFPGEVRSLARSPQIMPGLGVHSSLGSFARSLAPRRSHLGLGSTPPWGASLARSLAVNHIWSWGPLLPGELRSLARRRSHLGWDSTPPWGASLARRRSQLGWAKFPKPQKRFSKKAQNRPMWKTTKIQKRIWKYWLTNFDETKKRKWTLTFQQTESDFLKTKSETEIQKFLKPKPEKKQIFEMRFSKNEIIIYETDNRKSTFEIRIRNRNTKLSETKKRKSIFKIRCSKNEKRNRNTKFSETENRVWKPESEIEIQHFLQPRMTNRKSIFKIRFEKTKSENEIQNLNFLKPIIEHRF